MRQLEEVLARAITFSTGAVIGKALVEDLIAEVDECVDGRRTKRWRDERAELLETLRSTGGNVSRTAELLGRSRTAVYRLIERHRIPLAPTVRPVRKKGGARRSNRPAVR